MSMPTLNRQQRRQLEQQRSRQRAQRRVERPAHPPMLIKAQQTLAPLEAIIDQIERAGTVDTDRQGRPIFHCAADGQWYESAPQAPAGWRWTLHPAGLHPDVYAAAAAHTSDEARNAALEEAAVIVETAPDYLQDSSFNGAARAIRALKSTPAPTAAEGDALLPAPTTADRKAWEADMHAAGARHLGGNCWEWDVDDFEYRLWQLASHRQQRAEDGQASEVVPTEPLRVFAAGIWTYDGTGQAFSHTDLDEAAFVTYRDRAALAARKEDGNA
ncbi:hypothetical protein [Bordetella bronchiseptica]|uniref:hypothetical protein n=1 Tax=Bordetella bronchiseptica TaxID=518 RepID=UPI0039FC8884